MRIMTLEVWLGVLGLLLAIWGLIFAMRSGDAIRKEIRRLGEAINRISCGPPPDPS